MAATGQAPGDSTGQVVYESRFETDHTDGWLQAGSNAAVPVGHSQPRRANDPTVSYLGEFFGETIQLAVDKLPAHGRLMIECDLLILKTWDGTTKPENKNGPDRVTIRLGDGRVLMDATFSNHREQPQSFPDELGSGAHPRFTGAASSEVAGLPGFSGQPMNAIYHLRFAVPHSADKVVVEFQGRPAEADPTYCNTGNESWCVANVKLTVPPRPAALTQDQFDGLWAQLRGSDPVKAWQARWALAEAGPDILPMIRQELDGAKDPDLDRKIDRLIARLEDDSYATRVAATEALAALGQAAEPALHAALEADPSAEAGMRMRLILKANAEQGVDPLPGRLRHLLQIIGTDDARALLQRLPAASSGAAQ